MRLRILLPFQVFSEAEGVRRVVAETRHGFFGILPRRLDCVAALVPGILTYETREGKEIYVAVDEGTLVKTGPEVLVSVRRAHQGTDLAVLRGAVQDEFLRLDEAERDVRVVMARLETGLLRRLAAYQRELS
jgi:F-type H+-transporting ATPase subunit epsilon